MIMRSSCDKWLFYHICRIVASQHQGVKSIKAFYTSNRNDGVQVKDKHKTIQFD